MIPPWPLLWPDGTPRTQKRMKSAFRTELPAAIKNVQTSLRMFGAETGRTVSDVVCSSNVGGLLAAGAPADPGVAVWFRWDGEMRCIAVDRYQLVKENLQAIHHVLEARRTEMRHAGIVMVRATFKGFTAALPAPGEHWSDVLDLPRTASVEAVEAAWKARVRQTPDENDRARFNVARDLAKQELAGR